MNMKNENKKESFQGLINTYNEWVHKQENIFKINKISFCPYFYIDSNRFKKIISEHKRTLEEIEKQPPLSHAYQLWEKIISQNIREYKPTKQELVVKKIKQKIKFRPKELWERINPNNILFTTKLHENKSFIGLCRQRGLSISFHHLLWYEKNKIINPLLEQKGKNYYSIYQIYTLDDLETWKEDSLEYPNPTWCEGLTVEIKTKNGIISRDSPGWTKTEPVLWQNYLLWNKEGITSDGIRWNKVAKILLDIQDLFNTFFDETLRETGKLKKEKQNKKSLFKDIFNSLVFNAGQHYAQKIKKFHPEISESILRYWIGACATRVEKLNPVFKKSWELPVLLKLFEELEWSTPTAGFGGERRNQIKLANFYWKIINDLNFYLECLTGEKQSSIGEIFSSSLKNEEKICEVCGDKFVPNPKRIGGRTQKVCGKNTCEKELARKNAIKYRKNKKLNK